MDELVKLWNQYKHARAHNEQNTEMVIYIKTTS